MPAWKMDLIFEARGRGWRETYYANFSAVTFGEMLPFAQKLAVARIAMSAAPVEIKSYAVSDPISAGRQGQTFNFRPRYKAPVWPGDDGATDPSTAINIDFIRNANNASRRIQLRGCPDGILNDFGELTGPQYGAWEGKFFAWRQVLLGLTGQGVNANYGWFSRLPINVPAGKVSYSYGVGAFVPTLTFPEDFFPIDNIDTNQYIRIRGVNGGRSALNGEVVVFVTSRTTAVTTKPLALGPMITTGLAQRYAKLPTFGIADNVGISKAGRRAPGAPLGYTPGRRRARSRS